METKGQKEEKQGFMHSLVHQQGLYINSLDLSMKIITVIDSL